jgi:hypothetical protein
MLSFIQTLYFLTGALGIGLMIGFCLYMKRIAALSSRPAFFVLTLIAVGCAVCIRLFSLVLNGAVFSGATLSPATLQLAHAATLVVFSLLYLGYWPAIALLAWSASRAKRGLNTAISHSEVR